MKNRILILTLTLLFLLSPLSVFAQGETMLNETSAAASALEASLYPAGKIAGEAKLAFEYHPDEQEELDDPPAIGSKAAYIADPVSGKVFFEKNAHKKMYPASTTKLLTALLVLENCSLDETATVSRRAVNLVPEGYVRANLQPGEQLSVRDLLYALLIPSANDAAFVLAEHVGGSVARFAKLCNRRAKELGCEKLHFVNPNGIHSADHYCTAYDLFLLAQACAQFETFNEIVQTRSFSLPATNAYANTDRQFQNTNQLLNTASPYYYAGCTGGKTGFTNEAGQCMVSGCVKDELRVISVVLGGQIIGSDNQRFSDTVKLFDFVYNHYAYKVLAQRQTPLASVTVDKATKDTAALDVVIGTDVACVAPNEITPDNVDLQISLPEKLKAPIKENQVLGTATWRVDGLVYATNLLASHEVEKKPYWLFNLLVLLVLLAILLFIRAVWVQREKDRRRQELLRRRHQQQMQQRRQAKNQQDIRFRR